MVLYTGKGDRGDTGTFGTTKRVSKADIIPEALGSLDELNSFLGLVKVKAKSIGLKLGKTYVDEIFDQVQQRLFNIQASVAGAETPLDEMRVVDMEVLIAEIESKLPPLTQFIVPGGTELAAMLDVARTIARRAERRVVAIAQNEPDRVDDANLAYLNRLSSLLYGLARLANLHAGAPEGHPTYE